MLRSAYSGALLAVLALPLLAGCAAGPAGGGGTTPSRTSAPPTPLVTAAPVGDTTPTSSPATVSSAPATAPSPASAAGSGTAGCANGRTVIPAGARSVRVNDVDGDGRGDTAFFTTTKPYAFGFATSAGGVYTTPDRSSVTGAHHAWAVNTDGFPGHAVVIDDGLAARVLTFRNCGFQQLTTKDGSALVIAIGARSAAGTATTGVACNDQNGGILIEAAQARLRSDGRYDIAWSTLEPTGTATGAAFAPAELRFTGLSSSDARVRQARTSTCWAVRSLTVTH